LGFWRAIRTLSDRFSRHNARMSFRLFGVRHIERGRLLAFERRYYHEPGHETMVRETVRHPGSVAVIPAVDAEVVLLRQTRTPIGRHLLEIPAGLRDHAGEDPAETARRECEEETGYRPESLTLLHRFYNSPGFCDEFSWLYLGEDLAEVGTRPQAAEERTSEVVRMSWQDAWRAAREGDIEDAKTLLGLYALGVERGWV
jgi:ADP-ribose pyrophosphatase